MICGKCKNHTKVLIHKYERSQNTAGYMDVNDKSNYNPEPSFYWCYNCVYPTGERRNND